MLGVGAGFGSPMHGRLSRLTFELAMFTESAFANEQKASRRRSWCVANLHDSRNKTPESVGRPFAHNCCAPNCHHKSCSIQGEGDRAASRRALPFKLEM